MATYRHLKVYQGNVQQATIMLRTQHPYAHSNPDSHSYPFVSVLRFVCTHTSKDYHLITRVFVHVMPTCL